MLFIDYNSLSCFKFLGVHISYGLSTSPQWQRKHSRYISWGHLRRLDYPSSCWWPSIDAQQRPSCHTASLCSSPTARHLTRKFCSRLSPVPKKINGAQLPANSHCLRKATSIYQDSTLPCHYLFDLIPSGRCYKMLCYAMPTQPNWGTASSSG